MMKFVLRLILFLAGLAFAAALAFAVVVLATVWGLRYAWNRLLGRSVTPFVMRFRPGAGFERFRDSARPAQPSTAEVVNARALGGSGEPRAGLRADAGDVSDVQPKSGPRA